MKKMIGFGFAMFTLLLLFAVRSETFAAVSYLPGVTAAMSKPAYWAGKTADPDAVLITQDEADGINQAIIAGSGTGARNLLNWSRIAANTTYDGISRNSALKKAAEEDAKYMFGQGAKYLDGQTLSESEAMEKLYQPMIDNCEDPDAAVSMPVLYAICTTRTNLRAFPSSKELPDDPNDPDFDLQYLSAVNVGEALILRGKSSDGKYYSALSSYAGGWIPAEDIAICSNAAEWESAWLYDSEDTLVVYDDKIETEESNYSPATSKRKLHMGTCLKLADPTEWEGKIGNRYAYNNYVVWMPVRLEDGSYENQLALISEHCQVSEGFLPLTTANLLKVMFNQLGDTYGWGGMLSSQDCSGYARDVYSCFGLEIARNTTQQAAQPVRKWDLGSMTDDEKTRILKELPPGALLLFSGHAMLYLGSEGDELYVISSVSNLVSDGVKQRVRGAVINTLSITRPNGKTWLSSLSTAEIPYYNAGTTDFSDMLKVADIEDQEYTGQAVTPKPAVSVRLTDGERELAENVHYILSYENNTEAGEAAVVITGMGNYSGNVEKKFHIVAKEEPAETEKAAEEEKETGDSTEEKAPKETVFSVTLSKKSLIYNGKVRRPKLKVIVNGWELETSDYTVTWPAGSKDVGTYKLKVVLQNGYSGEKSVSYRIIPRGTSVKSVKAGKKYFTVKWKKQSRKMSVSRITGYRIQYAQDKNFTNGVKTVSVKKYSRTSKKIKGLKRHRKYYVRVRTYLVTGGKEYRSEWSSYTTVTTK